MSTNMVENVDGKSGRQVPDLYAELCAGLEARKGSWRGLARDTGVSHSWLAKVSEGEIQNPGIKQVQAVVQWMRSHPKD